MTPRTVHAIPPPPADDEPIVAPSMPRLRSRTNDPTREYASRAGEVQPLPDSVAALILCRKGWAKIERQQIKVTLDGQELLFASRDSISIAEHNGTGRRVLWALNRRAPEVLHILTDQGAYVESIPRKGEAQWFDQGDASRAAHGDAQAMLQRDIARLKELHRPAMESADADARHNAAQVRRLVQTFPAPAGRETQPAECPRAEGVAAAMRTIESKPRRNIDASVAARADTAARKKLAANTPAATGDDWV